MSAASAYTAIAGNNNERVGSENCPHWRQCRKATSPPQLRQTLFSISDPVKNREVRVNQHKCGGFKVTAGIRIASGRRGHLKGTPYGPQVVRAGLDG